MGIPLIEASLLQQTATALEGSRRASPHTYIREIITPKSAQRRPFGKQEWGVDLPRLTVTEKTLHTATDSILALAEFIERNKCKR
jgi:hypothetical protein